MRFTLCEGQANHISICFCGEILSHIYDFPQLLIIFVGQWVKSSNQIC